MDNIAVSGNFEITPCEQIADIESRIGFKKLALTSPENSDGRIDATVSCSNGNRNFERLLYGTIPGWSAACINSTKTRRIQYYGQGREWADCRNCFFIFC